MPEREKSSEEPSEDTPEVTDAADVTVAPDPPAAETVSAPEPHVPPQGVFKAKPPAK